MIYLCGCGAEFADRPDAYLAHVETCTAR